MNKFKVGDRVAVYCTPNGIPRRVTGTVLETRGEQGIRFQSDEVGMFNTHVKQCRKLKPKAKREWYVNVYANSIGDIAHFTREEADKAATGSRVECVKVREVK